MNVRNSFFMQSMAFKEVLSAVGIVLTFTAFLPYIRSIRQGRTKPHVFSWLIWGSVTFVVFLAQLAGKGGVGAWPIGVSGIITLYIAFLAYANKADIVVYRTDWLFLVLAMMSLPLWYLTSDPLWAVVMLTLVDLLGFGPTFRKAYCFPAEEQLTLFAIMTTRNVVSIAALEHFSPTTVLFPAATGAACFMLILMVTYRRRLMADERI